MNEHTPVLLDAVLEYLQPETGQKYLDVTAGYGGHAQAVIKQTQAPRAAVLVDRDQNAVVYLEKKFAGSGVQIIKNDFLNASRQLVDKGMSFDIILADLGVSSPHLEDASRGFSLKRKGPLDMRMDLSAQLDAMTIVNDWDEDKIEAILKHYGEEPKAREIAKRIVASRPLETTEQLAATVAKVWPGRSKVHPATRTFQAIRIAVNDELNQLAQSLPLWLKLLVPDGRLAIISFHSLEDRLVKQFLAARGGNRYDAEIEILTNKPISATRDEIVSNPRARSAKLRACRKK